jgi:predicted metal-dependent hydrolase
MTTSARKIVVGGVSVRVILKRIKHLHLGVYPPDGHVRVAAPIAMKSEAVRLAVISRLGWIRRHRREFEVQARQSQREMVTGESHYVWGRQHRLRVLEGRHRPGVRESRGGILELRVKPGTTAAQRERQLHGWYRLELRRVLPTLFAKWEPKAGVSVREWGIKRMKTKWGSCNPRARRIWLNLELAKKPERCLEYLLVHELLHLTHRRHDPRFLAALNDLLPDWRSRREELNRAPLAHEKWSY